MRTKAEGHFKRCLVHICINIENILDILAMDYLSRCNEMITCNSKSFLMGITKVIKQIKINKYFCRLVGFGVLPALSQLNRCFICPIVISHT